MPEITAKRFLARLLGAYLCIIAAPLAMEALILASGLRNGAGGLSSALYRVTLWGWIDCTLKGRAFFCLAFNSPPDSFIACLFISLLILCPLAALALWFKKPWRWWSAATLISASFVLNWIQMYTLAVTYLTLLALPLTYLSCFLGALIWRKIETRSAPMPAWHR